MTPILSPGEIARLACILEATARKPGNVHRFADFADTTYLDFLLSASAIARPLESTREVGVGRTVLEATRGTRVLVRANTNLGMILLLAPLSAVPPTVSLREGIESVLAATTVEDAQHVYQAIREARPGGLGSSDDQDVAGEPTAPLRAVMGLAADRDLVARQYANGFAEVFAIADGILRSLAAGMDWETATVRAYLVSLAKRPDSLIARKLGATEADAVSGRAEQVVRSGWPETPAGHREFTAFDNWLRSADNRRNPGATADLVTAALYVVIRSGGLCFPLPVAGRPLMGAYPDPRV